MHDTNSPSNIHNKTENDTVDDKKVSLVARVVDDEKSGENEQEKTDNEPEEYPTPNPTEHAVAADEAPDAMQIDAEAKEAAADDGDVNMEDAGAPDEINQPMNGEAHATTAIRELVENTAPKELLETHTTEAEVIADAQEATAGEKKAIDERADLAKNDSVVEADGDESMANGQSDEVSESKSDTASSTKDNGGAVATSDVPNAVYHDGMKPLKGENGESQRAKEPSSGTLAEPEIAESREAPENQNKSSEPSKISADTASDAEDIPEKLERAKVAAAGSSDIAAAAHLPAIAAAAAAPVAAAPAATAAPSQPLPVLKGTLSYNLETRRHIIRGMWNYENSTEFPPQRFELVRSLTPSEEVTKLPLNGEFHGSFSLVYFYVTKSGKRKERSKVIPESGVDIKFTPRRDDSKVYSMDGKGTNQFGVFHVNGTARPSALADDPVWHIELRKRYEPSTQPVATAAAPVPSAFAAPDLSTSAAVEEESGPLPDPSPSPANGIVCLRGKVRMESSQDLGVTEVVHRAKGFWAAGLNFIVADPENEKGLLCRFEYEHKSSVPTTAFPVSGRYSGWFDLANEDGTRTRINERDVMLKFRKNSGGYFNVEGKGSNVFGKYSISGTMDKENVITIFRHFVPRKIKSKLVTSAPPPLNEPHARRPSGLPVAPVELKLKMNDVDAPKPKSENVASLTPPINGTYSAVSRGILRVNEDGSHSCQGKWAVTRDHFTSGVTSNFTFRLEAHLAKEAGEQPENEAPFPLDSAVYKGSFQLKKQGSRYQTILDQQIVMKFRMNTQGAFNVYGKGFNAIGEFNLLGTLIMSGKTGGQLEVYRMYPPDRLTTPAPPVKAPATAPTVADSLKSEVLPATAKSTPAPTSFPGPPTQSQLQRRESTRMVKLPSKLEDDDPDAMKSRIMEKCSGILRSLRERDIELGAFFSEPVDPVALGIPMYNQIIREPMDLKTIQKRLDAGAIETPEEFARLCRLVFQNAMTFNEDPNHSVHQAGRTLLIQFNQKYRDVERLLLNAIQGKSDKKDKKRKRAEEPPKSLKKQRFEQAQSMAAENAMALSAITAAAAGSSGTVTRAEFTALYHMVEQLQRQIVQTHMAVADLSPGDENDPPAASAPSTMTPKSISHVPSAASSVASPEKPEKKKLAKRKSEPSLDRPAPVTDESTPLTFEEQRLLTDTINQLQPEQLGGVIQIIREAAPVGADEDEIDLEIDQLDHKTQRKLLRHVSKFVKKAKPTQKKKQKTTGASKKIEKGSDKKIISPAPQPAPVAGPFFAFGDDDSDDSDEEVQSPMATSRNPGKVAPSATSEFKLGSGLDDMDEDDDENDGDINASDLATSWNIAKETVAGADSDKKQGEDDDAWGAARQEAAAAKAREAERKAREEKMKADAEEAKKQRFAEAAARGDEIRALRAEEEEKEARLKAQQEQAAEAARNKAREEARAKVKAVERTVDMDHQRDMMKQYEESFLDSDLGGASPSSDFGF